MEAQSSISVRPLKRGYLGRSFCFTYHNIPIVVLFNVLIKNSTTSDDSYMNTSMEIINSDISRAILNLQVQSGYNISNQILKVTGELCGFMNEANGKGKIHFAYYLRVMYIFVLLNGVTTILLLYSLEVNIHVETSKSASNL